MENCKNKEAVCQCVDWSCEDAGTVVEHLLKNYEFDHLDLDYSSLDHGAKLRLCQIVRCRQCGRPICTGTEVYARELVSDTLSAIYDAAKSRWSWYRKDSGENFDEVFLGLLHGRDQQVARLWLDLLPTMAKGQHTDSEAELC